jgi:hypothetical protein
MFRRCYCALNGILVTIEFMINLLLDPLSRIREFCGAEEFRSLGLPGYLIPKGHSHVPCVDGEVKENFRDYESVAKCWMEGALLFRYRDVMLPEGASVALFTWVMPGGLGDWTAQHVTASLLRKAMPDLRIELFTLVDISEKRILSHPDFACHMLTYNNRGAATFPPHLLKKLANFSLILQLPTFYPHFNALLGEVKKHSFSKMPECAHVGEYGFIDSEWAHPASGNLCMGLNPLEKGLLLHTELTSIDILPSSPFYFAYLVTIRGAATYIHALLNHLSLKNLDITLILCNPLPFLKVLSQENWSCYNLKEIIVIDKTHKTIIPVSESGKKLIIECKENLSSREVQRLFLSSENFVGCRGDRSFSEVVSLERFFFYDPLPHSLPFLHDLYELAKYYFLAYPSLHSYLKLFLDQTTPPKILGMQISELLFDPSLVIGMQRLISFLKTDCLFNPTLINMVKAKITHHFYPEIQIEEETHFKEFLSGAHSLEELLYRERFKHGEFSKNKPHV